MKTRLSMDARSSRQRVLGRGRISWVMQLGLGVVVAVVGCGAPDAVDDTDGGAGGTTTKGTGAAPTIIEGPPGEGGTTANTGGGGVIVDGGAPSAPPWDYPDDITFEYTPVSGEGSNACASVKGTPRTVMRPVDIIFVIDNSGSMNAEIEEVEQNVYQRFANIIGASGVDYRVILISRYGEADGGKASDIDGSDYQVCIPPPLGATACTDPYHQALREGDRFFHYSADIESLDALCVLLESYDEPDEFDDQDTSDDGSSGSVYRNWSARAPGGWQAWLRPDSFKTFVAITDDDVNCRTNDFRNFVADQNFPGLSLNDGNSAVPGESVANAFDAALLQLSAVHFGSSNQRNYVWHSIVGVRENTPHRRVWGPEEGIQTGTCGAESSGPGTGYQALSRKTGGLRYPICADATGTTNFDPVFEAIAQGVIETAGVSCEYEFPDVDGLINPSAIEVTFAPSAGGEKKFRRVPNAKACENLDDYYFDDNVVPSKLLLCESACEFVRRDGGELELDFGCLGS